MRNSKSLQNKELARKIMSIKEDEITKLIKIYYKENKLKYFKAKTKWASHLKMNENSPKFFISEINNLKNHPEKTLLSQREKIIK